MRLTERDKCPAPTVYHYALPASSILIIKIKFRLTKIIKKILFYFIINKNTKTKVNSILETKFS